VEPPDLILVEVLEALPGRPISGERLVRPDGKISIGFYGEVDVKGLTPEQVKGAIIKHLRKFIGDETLGLRLQKYSDEDALGPTAPSQGATNPFPLGPVPSSPGVQNPAYEGEGTRPSTPRPQSSLLRAKPRSGVRRMAKNPNPGRRV